MRIHPKQGMDQSIWAQTWKKKIEIHFLNFMTYKKHVFFYWLVIIRLTTVKQTISMSWPSDAPSDDSSSAFMLRSGKKLSNHHTRITCHYFVFYCILCLNCVWIKWKFAVYLYRRDIRGKKRRSNEYGWTAHAVPHGS